MADDVIDSGVTVAGIPSADGRQSVSVVIPLYNEEQNVRPLCERLFAVLDALPNPVEVIIVDDGSRDRSLSLLQAEAAARPNLCVVAFRRNFGQTAAMMAGIDHATGDIVVMLDADLQNDPRDIPALLAKLDEGYDVVSGWRRNRKDAAIKRNFVSRVANLLISEVSGVKLHDYGCTLKAYRRDVLKGVRLYGEMHRFVPIYATWMGARVTELPVTHHPRLRGASKYGLERIFKVILDIMVVKFLAMYFAKPMYVFGGFGLLSIFGGLGVFGLVVFLRLFEGVSMIQTPLPILSVMMVVTGLMSLLMGLLAEMMVRTYYESQNKQPYLVHSVINPPPEA
ncbi:MAG: glycosyltransferase family 2 protein [Magnetospirillum sp.]|nr:glycosyltransferase family 2 protein [Magnetospirillum sp.]